MGKLKDFYLLLQTRILYADFEDKPIQLSLRQTIGTFMFDRILGGQDHEGLRQWVGNSVKSHLLFFHNFKQGRLRFRRRAVDLIDQHDIAEDRSLLAIYFVAAIIYSFGGAIVSMIVGAIAGIAAFFTTNSIGATAGIVTSIFGVFSSIFYIIFFVSLAFQYFSLVEKRDGTGILQRIESIGGDKNNFNNIEEQY